MLTSITNIPLKSQWHNMKKGLLLFHVMVPCRECGFFLSDDLRIQAPFIYFYLQDISLSLSLSISLSLSLHSLMPGMLLTLCRWNLAPWAGWPVVTSTSVEQSKISTRPTRNVEYSWKAFCQNVFRPPSGRDWSVPSPDWITTAPEAF